MRKWSEPDWKRAFVVLGPESSGTRLMTRLLIAGGCSGSAAREQPWDDRLFIDGPQTIVWRRSLPHKGQWPDIRQMMSELLQATYQPQFLIMSRDWHAMAHSQVQKHPPQNEIEALENIQEAYRRIFAAMSKWEFEIVNYEALVGRPEATCRTLFGRLDLVWQAAQAMEIYDGNAKYYEEKEKVSA